jgi:CDP-diacylglycerol--glycerol-3-phosphate 3-phosphatidyltransferase
MPPVYALKPRFQALLRPLVRQLARWGITANHVTVAALLFSTIRDLNLAFIRPTKVTSSSPKMAGQAAR